MDVVAFYFDNAPVNDRDAWRWIEIPGRFSLANIFSAADQRSRRPGLLLAPRRQE